MYYFLIDHSEAISRKVVGRLLFVQATGCPFIGTDLWDEGPVVWSAPRPSAMLFYSFPEG